MSPVNNRSATLLPMPGDIRVSVPRPIRHLTTFVLREQGDWFEQEIPFLRRWLRPGMKAIDIGANYGVYTLTLARAVGPTGQVWSFEPAASTAAYLANSIDANGFDNITLVRQGLSDRQGEAAFHVSANAELSSLNPAQPSGRVETIELTTLDRCRKTFDWQGVDFIKLDAEGEESRIVAAGGTLLREESPLIMLELKHARQINHSLLAALGALDYRLFRLLPGPGILVPFDPAQHFDPYLLNLFAARRDRIRQLSDEGRLLAELTPVRTDVTGAGRRYLENLPFTRKYRDGDPDATAVALMDHYAASLDRELAPHQRVACLRRAMKLALTGDRAASRPLERVATEARVAADLGQRNHAVSILGRAIASDAGVDANPPRLPFLPASERYDAVDPAAHPNRWLLSSVLERWVVEHAYSSYFTGTKALGALQRIARLGFADDAMNRRLELVSALRPGSGSG